MTDAIKNFYSGYSEDERLFKDNSHNIEFLTSMQYLERVISSNSVILDACAGAGAYSFALAERNHVVTACDLMPKHVEQLHKQNDSLHLLQDIKICNVLDMADFEDSSFDVVLCMGALYHLFAPEERKQAVDECIRVLKPGGIFAAAYINRHAQLLLALLSDGMAKYGTALECIENGTFDTESGGMVFYRSTPGEMASLMESAQLEKLYMVGTDGIAHTMAELINNMGQSDFERWLTYHYSACEDETLLGYSLHGLYVGRKNYDKRTINHT